MESLLDRINLLKNLTVSNQEKNNGKIQYNMYGIHEIGTLVQNVPFNDAYGSASFSPLDSSWCISVCGMLLECPS